MYSPIPNYRMYLRIRFCGPDVLISFAACGSRSVLILPLPGCLASPRDSTHPAVDREFLVAKAVLVTLGLLGRHRTVSSHMRRRNFLLADSKYFEF